MTMSERRDRPRLPLSGYIAGVDSFGAMKVIANDAVERGKIIHLGDGVLHVNPGDVEAVMVHYSSGTIREEAVVSPQARQICQTYTLETRGHWVDFHRVCEWTLVGIHSYAADTCYQVSIFYEGSGEHTVFSPPTGWLFRDGADVKLRLPEAVLPREIGASIRVAIFYVRPYDSPNATPEDTRAEVRRAAEEAEERWPTRPSAVRDETLRSLGGSESDAVASLGVEGHPRHGRVDRRGDVMSASASASDHEVTEAQAETRRQRELLAAERAKRIELERKLEELTRRRGPADGIVGKYERSIEEDDEEGE